MSFLGRAIVLPTLLLFGLAAGPADAGVGDVDVSSRKELDDALELAVERELREDWRNPFPDLEVESRNGIVILSGTVKDLRARERAGDVALTVRGVRAVVNDINVERSHVSDEELRERLARKLGQYPPTADHELRVLVREGRVTLSGRVHSFEEARLAEMAAMAVPGVRRVLNAVDVTDETERLDGDLEAEIIGLLENDVWLRDSDIDVNVTKGVVELSGTVGTAELKTHARVLSMVPGVESVDPARLLVRPWHRNPNAREMATGLRHDEDVARTLREAIAADPRLAELDIEAEVKGGVAVLRGTTKDVDLRRLAEETAGHTAGVIRVRNTIRLATAAARLGSMER